MVKTIFSISMLAASVAGLAQTSPAITSWLQNTTVKGRHYVSGNSTAIADPTLTANVQSVQYSANYVYVSTQGIPSYVTGPFLDGNPNVAGNQNAIFKFPLTPVPNTGSLTPTSLGNTGVFINGVALFDYRDGRSWNSTNNSMGGGPMNPPGDGVWNRDAIIAEKAGFDCAKGHPAGTNYHHHQNPSAFDLDINVISTVCNLYDADGLYGIDSTVHSPLLGFAYDGYPIYGAYGYKNVNGTGGIVRMKSSFALRSITTRTTLYTGAAVSSGPAVSTTYPLGTFKEDYQYNATSAATPDYLDIHNGRFCITPEYPNGTYCYFTTVNKYWNSVYPYVIGETFYGTVVAAKVTSVTEATTTYTPTGTGLNQKQSENIHVTVFPNPSSDLIAVQMKDLVKENYVVELMDITGKLVDKTTLYQGSTIVYFDTKTLYAGTYFVTLTGEQGNTITRKIILQK